LRNALAAGRVGHAYLFAGLRGTGKTTMARLLAKAVNCLEAEAAARPCNACAVCRAVGEGRLLDLIEIDAASHTSVDDVRELREKVGFRPNECRYKVYIIDEVHRFSGSAFDALLKTIEEPPDHAIFVLATTEIHKVPETILSRCQRFDFRRIPVQRIVERLQKLVEAESGQAEPEALALIARSATGSLRDAESLLDQLMATGGEGGVQLEQVQATLGTIDVALVSGLVDKLVTRDAAAGLALINEALDQGTDLRQFTRQIVNYLRQMLLAQLGSAALLDLGAEAGEALQAQAQRISTPDLLQAVRQFNQAETELRGGWQPQLPLELALVELTLQPQTEARPVAKQAPAQAQAPAEPSPARASGPKKPAPAQPKAQAPAPAQGGLTLEAVQERWRQVLVEMKARDLGVQALLNSARPGDVQADVVVLDVEHEFARNKLNRQRTRRLVEDVLSQVCGQRCRVEYKIGAASNTESKQEKWANDPLVQAAKDLGAEVRPIE
jgi:DNA polymerase-3 subunit gamma/tau